MGTGILDYYNYERSRAAASREAEAAVLAKFPGIIIGSSGWYRAVNAKMRRL